MNDEKRRERGKELVLTYRFVNSPRASNENIGESKAGPESEADY